MPPLEIEISSRFKGEARSLSAAQLDQLELALHALPEAVGNPTGTAVWASADFSKITLNAASAETCG